MNSGYVEQRNGAYIVVGTRVSLDSIVYAFLDGQSAEAIAQAFPVLTLEQVYGAITHYLAHRVDHRRVSRESPARLRHRATGGPGCGPDVLPKAG